MKKIIVDKSEGIAEVIDRILNEPDEEVSLVIPKGSALGRTASNFHLLKREADSAGRMVVVESVDDTILAFAKESGIEASHPLWKGVRGVGGFSDIVSRRDDAAEPLRADGEDDEGIETEKPKKAAPRSARRSPLLPAKVKESETMESPAANAGEVAEKGSEEEEDTRAANRFFSTMPASVSASASAPMSHEDEDDDAAPRGVSRKAFWATAAVIVVIAGTAVLMSTVFAHATVSINFKQVPWNYQGTFTASKNASAVDPSTNTVPAQVFTVPKNITETFPGSLVAQVSQKAQGTITIYNAYSAAAQELIVNTRFLTPDGKIFRITKSVTVPGETKGAGGALGPASVTAPIVADQPGPSYNIGPVAKLTIPGFQNDPGREAGFYGAITASTTGGFIGTRATPTAADIAAAKASTTAILTAALQGALVGMYPSTFKILDGATQVKTTSLTVNTSTDANGNFSVFAAGSVQAIGFDESAFKNYLLTLAQATEASSTFKTANLSYSSVSANFANGSVSFTVNVQAALEPQFSTAQFASQIRGMGIADARNAIAGLPELQDGEISLWPSWLWSIPSNPAKIAVTVN